MLEKLGLHGKNKLQSDLGTNGLYSNRQQSEYMKTERVLSFHWIYLAYTAKEKTKRDLLFVSATITTQLTLFLDQILNVKQKKNILDEIVEGSKKDWLLIATRRNNKM